MGKIIIIPNSDFSQNHIVKVDITKQVEKTVDSQNLASYSSSTLFVDNPSLKNNVQ